ncbi:MAG: membrane protein insertase YidC [Clostridiales bacterium]|nr:membrane protein insertase YidC [Clostridiales bacterium]
MDFLGKILGYVMHLSWICIPIYPLTVLLFTILTRVILLPVNIWVQKNSIKVVQIQPELNHIKAKYFGDRDRINEEMAALYKREKYHPFASLIPLVIQLVLLMGVIAVVKDPASAGMTTADMFCWGIDYYLIPWEVKGWYLLWPLVAGLAAWLLCVAQNRDQVLQAEQSNLNKYGLMALSVALSLYLGAFVRSGVALYWTFGNLIAIAQMYLLNLWINPKNYINYEALEKSKKELADIDALGDNETKEMRKRSKADYRRFFSITNKHLVFYSEKSGFYKYFKAEIEWLLEHSNITIHYITSDPDDQIFAIAERQPRIKPYYIGQKRLITLFMKLDTDILVMTTPDLENFYLKRSYVRKDIEYVYTDHSMNSFNMTLREGAMDHFDTIFCAGPYIVDEIRALDKLRKLPEQKTVEIGYPYLDELTELYQSSAVKVNSKKQILIAPSHQPGNIMESCLDEMIEELSGHGYQLIVRPHPQYIRRNPDKIQALLKKYSTYPKEELQIQTDFSSNETVYGSDLLITDWSSIAFEYSFATAKPSLFINTPMKVINPNWEAIGIEPIDLRLRKKLGISLELNEVANIAGTAEEMLTHAQAYADQIEETKREIMFHPGDAARAAGKYLLGQLSGKHSKS